jgi:hypothetical protein
MRCEALKRARAVKAHEANFWHSEAWLVRSAFACTEKKEAAAFFLFPFWFLFSFFFIWEVVSFLVAFSTLWGC